MSAIVKTVCGSSKNETWVNAENYDGISRAVNATTGFFSKLVVLLSFRVHFKNLSNEIVEKDIVLYLNNDFNEIIHDFDFTSFLLDYLRKHEDSDGTDLKISYDKGISVIYCPDKSKSELEKMYYNIYGNPLHTVITKLYNDGRGPNSCDADNYFIYNIDTPESIMDLSNITIGLNGGGPTPPEPPVIPSVPEL